MTLMLIATIPIAAITQSSAKVLACIDHVLVIIILPLPSLLAPLVMMLYLSSIATLQIVTVGGPSDHHIVITVPDWAIFICRSEILVRLRHLKRVNCRWMLLTNVLLPMSRVASVLSKTRQLIDVVSVVLREELLSSVALWWDFKRRVQWLCVRCWVGSSYSVITDLLGVNLVHIDSCDALIGNRLQFTAISVTKEQSLDKQS